MKNKNLPISTRDMVFTALFTAVLCAVAPFTIPIGPVPLSLATFIIYLVAGTLNWKLGALSVFLYVMIGSVGVPVFSNFGAGFQRIMGPTGGFIMGYVPCVLAAGLIIDVFKRKIWAYALGMAFGTALLYTFGLAWFMILTGNSLTVSLALCVTPFLPGDTAKIIAACVVAPKLQKAIKTPWKTCS